MADFWRQSRIHQQVYIQARVGTNSLVPKEYEIRSITDPEYHCTGTSPSPRAWTSKYFQVRDYLKYHPQLRLRLSYSIPYSSSTNVLTRSKESTSPPQAMMVPGPVISTTSYSSDWKDLPVENWILVQVQNNPEVLRDLIGRRKKYFKSTSKILLKGYRLWYFIIGNSRKYVLGSWKFQIRYYERNPTLLWKFQIRY